MCLYNIVGVNALTRGVFYFPDGAFLFRGDKCSILKILSIPGKEGETK